MCFYAILLTVVYSNVNLHQGFPEWAISPHGGGAFLVGPEAKTSTKNPPKGRFCMYFLK